MNFENHGKSSGKMCIVEKLYGLQSFFAFRDTCLWVPSSAELLGCSCFPAAESLGSAQLTAAPFPEGCPWPSIPPSTHSPAVTDRRTTKAGPRSLPLWYNSHSSASPGSRQQAGSSWGHLFAQLSAPPSTPSASFHPFALSIPSLGRWWDWLSLMMSEQITLQVGNDNRPQLRVVLETSRCLWRSWS